MIEKVAFTYNVLGSFLEIIPTDGMKDNSVYDIRIKKIKSLDGKKTSNDFKMELCTAFTPAYCTITDVQVITSGCDIEDKVILYQIREASKFADWITTTESRPGHLNTIDPLAVPFEVTQFVKYKAAYDSVLKMYIDKAAVNGGQGTLGDVTYDNKAKLGDISILLKDLSVLVDQWMAAVRGYKLEGRNRPVSALKGRNAIPLPQYGTPAGRLAPGNTGYSRGV